jgi:hypothetical protein
MSNETTPRTDAMASTMFPDGSKWVQQEDCRQLERELTEITKERDALAEAIITHRAKALPLTG